MIVQCLKVLIVIDSLAIGGAERCAVEMACGLDQSAFEPHVLVTRGSGPLARSLEDFGIGYTVLGRRVRFELEAARVARQWVRWADLVHAHKFGSSIWSALLVRGTKVPMLAHEHNWAGERSRLRSAAYRHLISTAAYRTVCVSSFVAGTLRREGVPQDRIVTLRNAVHPEVAISRVDARARLGTSEGVPVFGMVAGFRPEKAHEVAIEALGDPRLAAARARLCLIGSGPRERFLRDCARAAGVEDRIDWLGAVPDQTVPGIKGQLSAGAIFARAFDASLVCSDWEGLPLFALESMMAGTPLVATSVGELVHLCRGDAGYLVPPRDPAAVADVLAAILDDPRTAGQRAARAYERALAEHSFPELMRRLETLYLDAAVAQDRRKQARAEEWAA